MDERETARPREHDHLVEPLFSGLRDAHGAGERAEEAAGPEPAPILERSVPGWWLWVSVVAILAGALWLS